ncbi:hypothetical protein Q1695_005639 [Nippostrongylus brasiliensis]|nr:hypothetical protein Q1695_005639 [Nippostrongylus brasiliensis]
MIFFYLYLIFGSLLFVFSATLLITIIVQYRLREKYNVFSVKFIVDVLIATFLIVIGALDRSDEGQCSAVLVISTCIPLLQVLLLLCEVIDWSLAAFSPVYFHSSSLFSRILPFIVGGVFCAIIVAALVVIDVTTETSCTSSPTDTAVISAYDISLIFATVCVVALGVLLAKKLNSSLYRPVLFHCVSTLFLIEVPLLVVIALRYGGQESAAVTAADITNLLIALHCALHSAFFIYNHEDYRQGVRVTFLKFRVLSSI